MKIKRFFPALVIFLFSCILSIGTAAYLFFTTKYPEDTAARFGMSLWQGVVFAVMAFVLLLVGLGLNSLLIRIKDASSRKLVSLAVYLGSFVLCVVLPAIGIVSTYFLFSEQKGWQELPSVPAPAVQIVSGR